MTFSSTLKITEHAIRRFMERFPDYKEPLTDLYVRSKRLKPNQVKKINSIRFKKRRVYRQHRDMIFIMHRDQNTLMTVIRIG